MATSGSKLGCALAALGVAVVLVLVAMSIGKTVQRASPAPSASALAVVAEKPPPDVSAALDNLAPGDMVLDWTVHRIFVDRDQKHVTLELEQPAVGFSVWIQKKTEKPAPRQTDKYSIFFGRVWVHDVAPPKPGSLEPILDVVAARVRRVESTAPVPDGL